MSYHCGLLSLVSEQDAQECRANISKEARLFSLGTLRKTNTKTIHGTVHLKYKCDVSNNVLVNSKYGGKVMFSK